MNNTATSLENLHDIVSPPPVPWWPLAPAWYVVLLLALCVLFWLGLHYWKQWRANAYRRAALRELNDARTTKAIAEILKRTALSIAPRESIASLTDPEWIAWLSNRAPKQMPDEVRRQLTEGIYSSGEDPSELTTLRAYAAAWIQHHRVWSAANK